MYVLAIYGGGGGEGLIKLWETKNESKRTPYLIKMWVAEMSVNRHEPQSEIQIQSWVEFRTFFVHQQFHVSSNLTPVAGAKFSLTSDDFFNRLFNLSSQQ